VGNGRRDAYLEVNDRIAVYSLTAMRTLRLTLERLRPLITRAVLLIALVGGIIALGRSDALHRELLDVLDAAKGVIAAHPVGGPLAFIGLSALSALLAFLSSAVLVPAAVYAWGAPLTMLMLWIGWTLGGILAYSLALLFGRPVLKWVVNNETLSRHQHLLEKRPQFTSVLLFQLALPSEIPGYLLGLARYPLSRYLAALMIAELPYAVGTVLLGVGFIERNTATLVAVCLVGAVALVLLARSVRSVRADS
jgi:uncharacterized membrane protein YdjX (TVP38/TMEM64 family)